jgi:hypothetical protein
MSEEITLDQLRSLAEQAGLKLSAEELQRLLAGVSRSRKQASELRSLLSDSVPPAIAFSAVAGEKI